MRALFQSLNPTVFQYIPRIDDMLDQLNEAQYFTTLGLAVGYWQIRISNASREKTAFVIQQ